jgi:peptide/nickel transport system ATP-binding protein
MAQTLLEVQDLRTVFTTKDGNVKAVDGVSFHLDAGETLGIVGESGCGKSVTAMSIMRLQRPGRIVGGKVLFKGRDLTKASETEMREIRGQEIAMIFQDPMTSLNPVFRTGWQVAEPLRLHKEIGRAHV